MLLAPSKCLFKWINTIISKSIHVISKILFILESYKFLACLECISRNGLSLSNGSSSDSKWIKNPYHSTFRSCLAWVEQNFQNCWTRSDLCNYVWASWVLRSATTKEGYILRFIITGLDLFSYPRVAFSPPSHPQGCQNVKKFGGDKPMWWK